MLYKITLYCLDSLSFHFSVGKNRRFLYNYMRKLLVKGVFIMGGMDELEKWKRRMLKLSSELISNCPYCPEISGDVECNTPIKCTKWSGSSHPVNVNPATCLTCGEFKKPRTYT